MPILLLTTMVEIELANIGRIKYRTVKVHSSIRFTSHESIYHTTPIFSSVKKKHFTYGFGMIKFGDRVPTK